MSIFVVILQLVLVLVIHEWGHAFAASLLGFSFDTIFIGLPIQPKKTFYFRGKEIIVSPWLVGGGVNIKEEDILKSTFLKKTIVYSAGPLANIAAGLIVSYLTFGKAGLMVAWMYIKASFFAVTMLLTGHIGIEQVSSPIGVVAITHEIVDVEFVFGTIFVWLLLNFSVAIINLAPVPALDGGHIWIGAICSLFKNKPGIIKAAKILNYTFLVLILLLMVFLLARDIIQLIF